MFGNISKDIKSRRTELRPNLDENERRIFDAFVADKRKGRIYLLKNGALEAYLPEGLRSKDIARLIEFLAQEEFWNELSVDAKDELSEIAAALMPQGREEQAVPADGNAVKPLAPHNS